MRKQQNWVEHQNCLLLRLSGPQLNLQLLEKSLHVSACYTSQLGVLIHQRPANV
jgi:hypothetical protein